ncbi:MAG TPA: choice-of-anchor D domain-containing protein [Blastocatellia bacterium]
MRRLVIIAPLLFLVACSLADARGLKNRKTASFDSAADVTVSPGTLDFGDQVIGAVSKAQRVTVTNSGSGKLYIDSTALTGDDWQQFRVTYDTCTGNTLTAQKACVIDVVCTPTKRGGIKTALTIKDDAIGSPQTVTLTGNGINSADVPPSE